MARNFRTAQEREAARGSKLVFTKDVSVVGCGALLGVEEFIEHTPTHGHSATVVSDRCRVYTLSAKVR